MKQLLRLMKQILCRLDMAVYRWRLKRYMKKHQDRLSRYWRRISR